MGGVALDPDHFSYFRERIVGHGQTFTTPHGQVSMLYADWTASGRLYTTIEGRMSHLFGPWVGNTHSESSETGQIMTEAYHEARAIIKRHVNAGAGDAIITYGAGMTAVVCKLQRILGLRAPERFPVRVQLEEQQRPVVFVTHMEHHSNHISWRETVADVVIIEPDAGGLPDLGFLADQLALFRDRPLKIGAFSACSNVTGVRSPYHDLARLMHSNGGLCFVDFAASAPYVPIDMHPAGDPLAKLDAIYFSPHKFLGGPGSSGVLVFDRALYANRVPDNPGGGTVAWTTPWDHKYAADIELREDGGTPGFLQAIRAALAISLKEAMHPALMLEREHALVTRLFRGLDRIPGLAIMAPRNRDRLGIVSVVPEQVTYNLMVKLLNDRYGIQVRGGCSCAGTYGHYLLGVDPDTSARIMRQVDAGDQSAKPGWVRVSLHPTMTEDDVDFIAGAVAECCRHGKDWGKEYDHDRGTNEYRHRRAAQLEVGEWFRSLAPAPQGP